jgi:hypothetical protein
MVIAQHGRYNIIKNSKFKARAGVLDTEDKKAMILRKIRYLLTSLQSVTPEKN